jgi:hypothetical protein
VSSLRKRAYLGALARIRLMSHEATQTLAVLPSPGCHSSMGTHPAGRAGVAPERTPHHGRAAGTNQRIPPPHKPAGDDISLTLEFLFLERGLPPAFSSGTSSRPRNQAYSTAGPFRFRGV